MAEVQDAVGSGTQESRAVDYVGLPVFKRLEQAAIVAGVVFKIGVLDDDVIAGRFLNASAQGGSFSHVAGLQEDAHVRVLLLEVGENLARSVAGTVIDAKQLEFKAHGQNALDHATQGRLFVVDGHYNG